MGKGEESIPVYSETDMQSSVTTHRLLILVTPLPDNLQQNKCVVKNSLIIMTC